DCQRVGFFSGSTARTPDAKIPACAVMLLPLGDNSFPDELKMGRFAKEVRLADRQVVDQIIERAFIAAEPIGIGFRLGDVQPRHPAADADFGTVLAIGELKPRPPADQRRNRFETGVSPTHDWPSAGPMPVAAARKSLAW